MIVDPVNDIFKQAHQGSVAAIIQVLNDKLADFGVRTRAIFANGVLQLLCEAPTQEQLEQTLLTDQIRKILEGISPRNIRRVNINSRIVREQQLLWLEEINRDPEGQLLWSKEITLARQNPFKRLLQDWRDGSASSKDFDRSIRVTPRSVREKRQFTKGILGGLGLSAALLLAGWGIYAWQNDRTTTNAQTQPSQAPSANTSTQASLAPASKPATPVQTAIATDPDPFAVAVRLAEKASEVGTTAQTPAQWQEISEMWDKASNLMGSVPATDKRYAIAQDRTALYRKYQESALQKIK